MLAKRLTVLALVLPCLALAEDPKAKAAREELEKQLSQMMGKVPTRVRVDIVGLDDPNYKLEEASFELDGRTLPSPSVDKLTDEGQHEVWEGDAAPGKHVVRVKLVFANGTSVLLSDEGGYKWKIGGEVSFDLNAGIEVRVAVTPRRDSSQKDIAKRFKLSLPAQPIMLARLDDGTMPEAPPKPNLPQEVDAGVQVAALTPEELKKKKAEEAAELKRLAEEDKKAKAEAAAELKRAAAEEKKRKAAEAAEAKRAAAEEKKRKAAEAAEAKRAAAEEKKRLAAEAAEAKRLEAERKKHPELANLPPAGAVDAGSAPVAVAEPPPAVDAGAPEVDAGVAVAVAPPPAVVDAGAPVVAATTPPEEGSSMMPVIIGAGVGGLVVLLIIVARRRARPPSID
ncbi:MAG: hypothetical protein U0228_17025 [Myxococcaceae bacterium]